MAKASKKTSETARNRKRSAKDKTAPQPVALRDRIKELRRVRACDLVADPRNFQVHSDAQRKALAAMFAEVGMANAVLAWEAADGRLTLIDGHLRSDVAQDALIPVLVLDVDEIEAGKLLATLDPIAAMAKRDEEKHRELMAGLRFETPDIAGLLADIAALPMPKADDPPSEDGEKGRQGDREKRAEERFSVLIDCESEAQQAELLERFETEGLKCRALIV